jgi:hypothetical protein
LTSKVDQNVGSTGTFIKSVDELPKGGNLIVWQSRKWYFGKAVEFADKGLHHFGPRKELSKPGPGV